MFSKKHDICSSRSTNLKGEPCALSVIERKKPTLALGNSCRKSRMLCSPPLAHAAAARACTQCSATCRELAEPRPSSVCVPDASLCLSLSLPLDAHCFLTAPPAHTTTANTGHPSLSAHDVLCRAGLRRRGVCCL